MIMMVRIPRESIFTHLFVSVVHLDGGDEV